MTQASARRVGRPSARVLTRQRIVETALRLLDEHGEEGFGMRDVALALGVRPSALYNHVAGKDDILTGIRELIGERISDAALDTPPWDAALAAWARSYRDAFAAHPPTIALLAVMPLHPDSHVSEIYDRVIRLLCAEGWTRVRAINILVALESFILGSALDLTAAPDMLDPGPRDDVPEFREAYDAREREVARTGIGPAEQAFEAGLELLLGGLRAEQAALAARVAQAAQDPARPDAGPDPARPDAAPDPARPDAGPDADRGPDVAPEKGPR